MQEICQDICLAEFGRRQEACSLVEFAFISPWLTTNSAPYPGNPGPVFNKACIKFGSKMVVVVLFSPVGLTEI